MERPTGYLVLTAIDSSGRNKDDAYVWGPEGDAFDAYVKVELRGGARNVKVATRKAPVQGGTVFWNEPLVLEVLEHANELRVMVCKDKLTQQPDGTTKRGTQVVAACGIYVSDILDAVPIDKYFELYRPGAGGEGGFIRLGLDYSTEPPTLGPREAYGAAGRRKKGRRVLPWLLLGAALVAGAVLGKRWHEQQQEEKQRGGGAAANAKTEPRAAAAAKKR